jgi:hypothetical protein
MKTLEIQSESLRSDKHVKDKKTSIQILVALDRLIMSKWERNHINCSHIVVSKNA